MDYLIPIAVSVLFGILNALRGGNYVGRVLCAVGMGLVLSAAQLLDGVELLDAAVIGLIAALGLYVALLFGWGKGLAAITGRYPRQEKDFWPADKAGDWVHDKTGNGYYAGTAFMTVRGLLFYLPFLGLGMYADSAYLAAGFCVVTFGLWYLLAGKLIGEKHGTRLAEFLSLACIGLFMGAV